ncbi:MAG: thiamine diphosphokinase [Clostridia bacterium]|nr:thiamine diphosphokinase [Clostridia bacterium]
MKRCVIVGGADILDYEKTKEYLSSEDFYIFCDCGLRHSEGLGVEPNLIVGDFDSSENPKLDTETIVLPREKDDTDTVFAVKEAINRGFEDFLILGVIGQRLDHTLGNVSILKMLFDKGFKALIVDDYCEMTALGKDIQYIPDTYPYFSLINVFGKSTGIIIKNAKYPLENAEITCDYQFGVSNEVIKGEVAEVSVRDGVLLLVKVR